MPQQTLLIQTLFTAALALVLGAVSGFFMATQRSRRRLEDDDKIIKEQQLRSEDQRRIVDEAKSARIREIELELERLKMTHASFQQTEARFRQDLERRLMEKEAELRSREQRLQEQDRHLIEAKAELSSKNEEYARQVSTLVRAHEEYDKEKARVRLEEEGRRSELIEKRRLNWIHHEKSVEENLRNLCKRIDIVYHDKRSFPLTRKPDCAIEVGGQFVILDAKAPADPAAPDSFYEYLKKQAEQMEKYLKQEGVRKEAFLVVPTDALAFLQERFYFEIASFRIFVISIEALEPALRLYRKIEEFEMLQALGPEAQDEIATFVGQASRMIKRRVQIDHFMSEKFIELLMSGESLPEEILKKSQAKEKNFVLNTPRLDRGKSLLTEDLKKKQDQQSFHIEGMDINSKLGADALEGIPLERLATPEPPPVPADPIDSTEATEPTDANYSRE